MSWPSGTSVTPQGAYVTPVAGSGGASWTYSVIGTVTLSTGQTLPMNHTGPVPAAGASALQALWIAAAAAEGVTLNWP